MSAPVVLQLDASSLSTLGRGAQPLYWISNAGVLALANDTTPLPVTATLAAGTAVIGHVIVDSGTLTTVSTVTNLSQFGTFAINLGAGAVGTGTLRVTHASDDPSVTSTDKVIPATTAAAVTPSDSTVLASRAVWVGGAGDLSVRLSGATSTTVVFTAVPAGSLLPISVVRIMAATTATNINVLA